MAAGKKFLFQLAPEELSPDKMVKWATKLPSVAKTGDVFQDDELKMRRDAFIRVIDKLWRNPDIILQAANWVDNRVSTMSSRDSTRFFDSVSQLRSLDETWICTLLSSTCSSAVTICGSSAPV